MSGNVGPPLFPSAEFIKFAHTAMTKAATYKNTRSFWCTHSATKQSSTNAARGVSRPGKRERADLTDVRVPGYLDELRRRRRVRYRAARLSGSLLRWRHCGPVVHAEGEAVYAGQRRQPRRHGGPRRWRRHEPRQLDVLLPTAGTVAAVATACVAATATATAAAAATAVADSTILAHRNRFHTRVQCEPGSVVAATQK